MDFFDRQERARRRTTLLVFLFGLAVVFTVLAVNLVFALIFRFDSEHPGEWARLWNARLFAGVTGGTLAVILLGSLVKILELRQGGSAVATLLGGTPIPPGTTDPHERKLLNVVEEMALASGVPVPRVYLLDREPGINAFAAGLGMQDAAIGVTRGCLRLLSRDELQGVIAHEFSHVLNGDMRLNLRLIGMISGLLVLTILGRQLLWVRGGGRSRGGKDGGQVALIGLGLILVGGIGLLFTRLIKSAVSRQREYLADAAAVQFTRNPAGLGGALKKIGGLAAGSRLKTPKAEEASHLFFGNGMSESWLGLFSTHPPLVDRIRRLDPQFDGTFPRVAEGAVEEATSAPARQGQRVSGAVIPTGIPVPTAILLTPGSAPRTWSALGLVAQAGTPTAAHLRHAERLLGRLPEGLIDATREPLRAAGLVLSFLLSADPARRDQQLGALDPQARSEYFGDPARLLLSLQALDPRDRLPLVMLAVPSLRRLSLGQYTRFSELLGQWVEGDGEIDLFEYALQRLVRRHLAPAFAAEPEQRIVQFYSLGALLPDCAVLLSALAHQGHDDDASVAQAFAVGANPLAEGDARLALLEPAACGLPQIDAVLDRLAQASPAIHRQVLEACARTVSADGRVSRREAEILRAIADSLGCPIPPVVDERA